MTQKHSKALGVRSLRKRLLPRPRCLTAVLQAWAGPLGAVMQVGGGGRGSAVADVRSGTCPGLLGHTRPVPVGATLLSAAERLSAMGL